MTTNLCTYHRALVFALITNYDNLVFFPRPKYIIINDFDAGKRFVRYCTNIYEYIVLFIGIYSSEIYDAREIAWRIDNNNTITLYYTVYSV